MLDRGAPPCPSGASVVSAGTELQAAVDGAEEGATLCLAPGVYDGPLVVQTPITILGPAAAVIRSKGEGTTVRVSANGAALRGFTVEGSGMRYDQADAAVYVRADDAIVSGLTVRGALFGVVVERSNRVAVTENDIEGIADLSVGLRGDGIRLWEVRGSTVAGNRLRDSRDILIWYSPGNRIVGNTVLRSRYGTHFMYSDDSVVEGNEYRGNLVGVFVMYSRGVLLRRNVLSDSGGFDGMGLGVKESGNLVVEDNAFLRDRACIYLDTSPARQGDSVVVRTNTLAGCTFAVTFHSTASSNTFADNVFVANTAQVTVEGRGNARGVMWDGNYFDDYEGYDLDGDGFGDVAYELRSLSERLVSEHPQLAFFRGTVALDMLDVAARVFPVLRPETMLVDARPRMSPSAGGG
jgi:nitrous oxidase accessory protein